MLKRGDRIPDFSLPDATENAVQISEVLEQGPVVIFFYPKDETRGCIREACSFRDHFEEFTESGVTVIGISKDSPKSHRQFAKKHQLPFTLLSDRENKVRKQFGVTGSLFGLIPGRVTFIVDSEGMIQHTFNSQVKVEQHVEEALGVIRSMERATRKTANG